MPGRELRLLLLEISLHNILLPMGIELVHESLEVGNTVTSAKTLIGEARARGIDYGKDYAAIVTYPD